MSNSANISIVENAEQAIAEALQKLDDTDELELFAALLAGALGVIIVRSRKPAAAAQSVAEILIRISAEFSKVDGHANH